MMKATTANSATSKRSAGERVLGAHAEEQADVQRALHYDDVGEGKGRRKKEQEGRQPQPWIFPGDGAEVRE